MGGQLRRLAYNEFKPGQHWNGAFQMVVHCKKSSYDVYVGRPSKWGNPFTIGKDGNREEVIQKYKEWFQTQPNLIASLHELRGKTLGCWCSPKACHADYLYEIANKEGI